MSQLIAPRPLEGGGSEDSNPPPNAGSLQKIRKISTACGACKQRKTRCIYDATSDQRRKIANQRNVQDLAEAQNDLERIRQLMGGIIAIIRAGHATQTSELVGLIHTGVDLPQLAAYVRNEVRTNRNIEAAFQNIDFNINGPADLPSPHALLAGMESRRRESCGPQNR
ncbi:hypothetical protein DV735_g1062, partial [Chaetothyriales sp. CBS 134920]